MDEDHGTSIFFPHQGGIPIEEDYQLYLPRSVREPFQKMEAYWIESFLTPEECSALIPIIIENGERSTTSERDVASITEARTSISANLSSLNDPFIGEIDMRICRYMGMNWTRGEGLQGQYYGLGEEFRAHHDYFTTESQSLTEQGQRSWTFMVFLNEVEEGGRTIFPLLGRAYTPRTGAAVAWRNLDLAGKPNPFTLHSAEPITKGSKAILTKWFRQRGDGPKFTKAAGEYLPTYSSDDMRKMKIPGNLHQKILAYTRENQSSATDELGAEDFIKGTKSWPSQIIDLPSELRHEMHNTLKPILEQWSGVPLTPSLAYGVRRYREGAMLSPHLDTYATHIISATLNIDQKTNQPWPLHVRDSYYRQHEVVLEPGEMLLYEGARLEHGRLQPLDGEYYDSAFVHFYP